MTPLPSLQPQGQTSGHSSPQQPHVSPSIPNTVALPVALMFGVQTDRGTSPTIAGTRRQTNTPSIFPILHRDVAIVDAGQSTTERRSVGRNGSLPPWSVSIPVHPNQSKLNWAWAAGTKSSILQKRIIIEAVGKRTIVRLQELFSYQLFFNLSVDIVCAGSFSRGWGQLGWAMPRCW